MKFNLKVWSVIIIVMLLAVSISGCAVSKKSYQEQMSKILTDTKDKLDKLTKERQTPKADQAAIDKKEIAALKIAKDEIDGVSPPDDFYIGHADLVQFLDLQIKGKEALQGVKPSAPTKPGEAPQLSEDRAQALKMVMGASRALARVTRELPFLEFDLMEAFSQLTSGGGLGGNPGFGGNPGSMIPGAPGQPGQMPPTAVPRQR